MLTQKVSRVPGYVANRQKKLMEIKAESIIVKMISVSGCFIAIGVTD